MVALTILVTGGAGYIGSHTIIELLNAGHSVVCIDNCYNAYLAPNTEKPESIKRVEEITGKNVIYYDVDIRDADVIRNIIEKYGVNCVAHFAALKAVGESCRLPLQYYQNNVGGTCVLLEAMAAAGIYKFVYSSSATVYGDPQKLPIEETHPTGNCTNPYGKSKYFSEEILKDLCTSDSKWEVIALRYFNPVGSHKSGRIGEDPNGEPNNLMPYISQVAVGKRDKLRIFGNDYPTKDGTGVRDYIHVVDLAVGHVNALDRLGSGAIKGFVAYNLGTGIGYSVLEMVKAFSEASQRDIPYEIVPRRPGDVATSYADASLAASALSWRATRGIKEMCEDTWKWQQSNPNGFKPS